jgi:hypothetical protein
MYHKWINSTKRNNWITPSNTETIKKDLVREATRRRREKRQFPKRRIEVRKKFPSPWAVRSIIVVFRNAHMHRSLCENRYGLVKCDAIIEGSHYEISWYLLNKTTNSMHNQYNIFITLSRIHRSTCFGHCCAHHQEPSPTAHAASDDRMISGLDLLQAVVGY